MSEEWTAARIAELRRLAQEARREDAECEHLGEATMRFCYATDTGAVLSLLDALESERERTQAMRNEVICLRAELAEYSAEFGP